MRDDRAESYPAAQIDVRERQPSDRRSQHTRSTRAGIKPTDFGWIGVTLVGVLAPLAWFSPALAVAVGSIATALVLAADFTRAIVLVLVFETFFALFENQSAAIQTFPVGTLLLALLLSSAGWSHSRSAARHGFCWTPIDYAVGAFIAVCLLGTFASSNFSVALGGTRDELRYFLVYLAVRWAGPSLSAAKADRIARVIVCLLLIVAAVGVLQYFVAYSFLADFAKLPSRFAEQYMGLGQYSPDGGKTLLSRPRRVYSILASPLYTGYAAMGGALMAAVMYEYRVIPRWAAGLLFELFGVCLFFTYTRSAMVGFFAGLVVFAAMFLRWGHSSRADNVRFVSSLTVGLVVLGVLLYIVDPALLTYPLTVFSSDATVTSDHYRFLRQDMEYVLGNPLGGGTGSSSLAIFSNNPNVIKIWTESWYFYVAAELGIPGLAVYLTICALVLRHLLRVIRLDANGGAKGWRALGTTLWFVALLVAGIAGVPFFSWMLAAAIWTLIALSVNEIGIVVPIRHRAYSGAVLAEGGGDGGARVPPGL